MRGEALAGELVAFQEGYLGGCAGLSEEDDGDGVQRVVDAGKGDEHDDADGGIVDVEDDERDGEGHDQGGRDTGKQANEDGHEDRETESRPIGAVAEVTQAFR